jgi:hypothetical protein
MTISRGAASGGPASGGTVDATASEPLRNAEGEPLRILLVEDEALVALDLIETVGRMGATVVAALATEDEAVEAFASHQPDVVMMDVRLRAGDGINAAHRLRASGPAAVVFVTGSTDADTRRRMEAIPGARIVYKPVRAHELRSALRAACGGSTASTMGTS